MVWTISHKLKISLTLIKDDIVGWLQKDVMKIISNQKNID